MSVKTNIPRRHFVLGGIGAAGIGVGGFLVARGLLTPRYPYTPYDDLLARLPDRESAAVLGRAFLKPASVFSPVEIAADLRHILAQESLEKRVASDLGSKPSLVEVEGWVLPETLVTLCALAATPWRPANRPA